MSNGTIVFEVFWPDTWPPKNDVLLSGFHEGEVEVVVTALTTGSITTTITDASGRAMHGTSVPLTLNAPLVRLGVSWQQDGPIRMAANGVQISFQNVATSPTSVTLEMPMSPNVIGFDTENAQARAKRVGEVADIVAPKGHRLRTLDEEFQFLRCADQQLADLARAIETGHSYHFFGLIALVRSLIARGGKNFRPLLQRMAGRLDSQLLLFTTSDCAKRSEAFEAPQIEIQIDIRTEQVLPDDVQIDLDVWLDRPCLVRPGGIELSNNTVVRLLADGSGSHFDPYISADLEDLNQFYVRHGAIPTALTVAYTLRLVHCIRHLIGHLSEQYETRTS